MTKPREAIKINPLIDNYCENYQKLFKEVRTFEGFKYLHLGIISSIKRKTLLEIAKIVGLENFQNLHNVITSAEWSAKELKETRLEIILRWIAGEKIEIVIDETGDRKKGKTTDYVKRQYIGNLGKVENGIVSVNAYGIYQGIAIPLISKIYKPNERLKEGDVYKSKPEIAGEIIKELKEKGFKIKLVLADSLYGESSVQDKKRRKGVAILTSKEFDRNLPQSQTNSPMNQINLLRQTLKQHLPLHGARLHFLALFLIALIRVRTVDLTSISLAFRTSALPESSYKRLQRFFADFWVLFTTALLFPLLGQC